MAAVATPPSAPALDAQRPPSEEDSQASSTEKPVVALVPDTPPSRDQLKDLTKSRVGASDGSEQSFGSLFEKPGRHMIIFIRHFLCGMCQDFVTHLSENMPPSSLPSDTSLSIIGCGKPELIDDYKERTRCPYPIYSDSSRTLYDALGMMSNFEYGDQKPSYQTRSLTAQIKRSLWQGLTNLNAASKSGKHSQLGGEMFVETSVDGTSEVTWCHWMKNTRGHAEVDDLKKIIFVG